MAKLKIKLTRNTRIEGESHPIGATVTCDAETAVRLQAYGKGTIVPDKAKKQVPKKTVGKETR